jgi:hypothetical protein
MPYFFKLVRWSFTVAKFNCPHQKVAIKLFSHSLDHYHVDGSSLGPVCVFFSGWPVTATLYRIEALLNLVGPQRYSPMEG